MKNICLIALSLIVIGTSCKVHFTEANRDFIEQSPDMELEKIQFYTSHRIELVSESPIADGSIKDGKVKFKNGERYEHITIPRNTPVLVKPMDATHLKAYVEEGAESYLVFVNSTYDASDHYYLTAERKGDSLWVNYQGQEFYLKNGVKARLKFHKKNRFERKHEKRKAKGVEVN